MCFTSCSVVDRRIYYHYVYSLYKWISLWNSLCLIIIRNLYFFNREPRRRIVRLFFAIFRSNTKEATKILIIMQKYCQNLTKKETQTAGDIIVIKIHHSFMRSRYIQCEVQGPFFSTAVFLPNYRNTGRNKIRMPLFLRGLTSITIWN